MKHRTITLFLILGLLAGVGLIACLAIFPSRQPSRVDGRLSSCMLSLKAVALALHNYHEDYGSFPPVVVRDNEGQPMHSWRALIFPYLDGGNYYAQYDFAQLWNSPSNLDFAEKVLTGQTSYYQSCHCQARRPESETVVLAVTGADTAWPPDRCVSLGDVTDGHDSTFFLVAVSHSGIGWFEPRDISLEDVPKTSAHGDGVHAGLVDGSVHFLPSSVSSRAYFTIDAGDKVSPDRFEPASKYR